MLSLRVEATPQSRTSINIMFMFNNPMHSYLTTLEINKIIEHWRTSAEGVSFIRLITTSYIMLANGNKIKTCFTQQKNIYVKYASRFVTKTST